MIEQSSKMKRLGRGLLGASVVAVLSTFASTPASAHFVLKTPASWMSQDGLGNPQKLGPCGDDAGGSPTGKVTAAVEGDTITITIDETIYHPGHYRIALAVKDRSELPAEPKVTAIPNYACGTAVIQNPPVFPVLADGVLAHTAAFPGPQTIQVKLPAGVTCDHCTLQVIEFMSNHGLNVPGGCYYHHCADLAISSATMPSSSSSSGSESGSSTGSGDGGAASTSATTGAGAGSTAGAGGTSPAGTGGASAAETTTVAGVGGSGGSTGEGTSAESGCGCSIPGGGAPRLAGIGSLVGLAMLLRRRRGRR
jgi:Lytic polysaccharide mono-oxygenase, cellulose-degrading